MKFAMISTILAQTGTCIELVEVRSQIETTASNLYMTEIVETLKKNARVLLVLLEKIVLGTA
jgi:hypothetical protein